jgi:hypothetical protein
MEGLILIRLGGHDLCLSMSQVIDRYERISDINQQVRHYIIYLCLQINPSILIENVQNYGFKAVTPQIVSYLVERGYRVT